MLASLDFIYQMLMHRHRLVFGYEIVSRGPNGKRQLFRYLRVGKGSEMEVDLGERMLLKQRNGRPTMYREMSGEAY